MTDENDKQYHDNCHQLFEIIEALAEEAGADVDNDGNVIEILTEADEKIIINKQTPMREVWLAAKSGGRHFKFKENEWRDTRDDTSLLVQLQTLLESP